ncbi:NAD(P)H-binding protein [Nonomuraea sp. NPDC050643]|uniref:SDR family oxidoreductase n=1 Tax=Nonomuraea sp. NPDC050643 TaxID=3155660 RepID=UPI0033F51E7C
MNIVILVTGATGNIGRQVLSQLLDVGVRVRALTRDLASAHLPDGVEAVRGDLSAPETLEVGMRDVEAVFMMWPLPSAELASAAMEVVKKYAQRVVFLSSGAIRDDLIEQIGPIAQLHADVEQAIKHSGVEWTFLRPHGFATNTRRWLSQIRSGDVVRGAYGDAAMTLLHERDIAAVAVRALTRDGHGGRDYVLTGPELLTQAEQARIIGDAIGRPLRWEEISSAAARQEMLAWQPAEVVDVVLNAYADMVTWPGPITSAVEDITGKPAHTFLHWATDHAADFR